MVNAKIQIMGKLFVVATPIGNLEDITFRAVETLRKVGLIAAEDTRVTKKLLNHLEIDKKMVSYFEHNEELRTGEIIKELANKDVALVSDAGTPGISDPGYKLIREAIARGFEVVPIPGACAAINVLVASGMETDSFVFVGFLPKKLGARKQLLSEISMQKRSIVIYESAYRLVDRLNEIFEIMGDRKICVGREMTKKFEEYIRGSLGDLMGELENHTMVGEIAIVIEGNKTGEMLDDNQIEAEISKLLGENLSVKQISKIVSSRSNLSASEIYTLAVKVKDEN